MSDVFQLDEETYELIDRAIEIYPELIERVSLISSSLEKSREEGRQEGIAAEREKGLEESRQAGYQEGYQEGFQEGYQEGIEVGKEEGKIAAKQDTLFQLLNHRFDDIPTPILTMVDQNEDFDRLKEWTNIVLDLDDLEQIVAAWQEALDDPEDNSEDKSEE